MASNNRVAVALGLASTGETLGVLNRLGNTIGLAEIRLDLMQEFDLERIVSNSPCPLIITCRPQREGGSFSGSEAERLDILARASELNCSYVDVEWDSITEFRNKSEATRVIVSRHDYHKMPSDLWQQYSDLRNLADVVKLVGFAKHISEAIGMVELAAKADTPVIAIAMGGAGSLSRLLAPCFDACLLTYGAIDLNSATAPGQYTVQEMVERYAIDQVSTNTRIDIYLYTDKNNGASAVARCGGDGSWLGIPVLVEPEEVDSVTELLHNLSPRISTTLC
ncbi:MAG: type I 3-dehydroquinate dehydratase [Arenicellales bacterium]|nr:type I 3-dehydroquinate dehydratase [Arenicellales bacterium]